MARIDFDIEVVFSKDIIELMSELLSELNELAELIPDWQRLEAQQTCDNISLIMGRMLESQRIAKQSSNSLD
jgi:hypothetical protein